MINPSKHNKGEDRLMLMDHSISRAKESLKNYWEIRNKERIFKNESYSINAKLYLKTMKSSLEVFNECLDELIEIENLIL